MTIPIHEWRPHGRCYDQPDLTPLFFSQSEADQDRASAICDTCPVKLPCRAHAVEHYEYGVWGGTTEDQRRRIRKRLATNATNTASSSRAG